jgi:predicted AlkP superfamily pyrophosphatase or phosphodiesterase
MPWQWWYWKGNRMRKVALISLDALSETEFDRLKKLKNFSRFIERGVYSKNLKSVYPTQTYTVHTSVITGNYPKNHGVYNNQYFQPFVKAQDKEWFWYRHQINSDTLYDAVRKQNGRVCSVLWPVTGKAGIKYNIPEIVAIKNENQALKVMKSSSVLFSLKNEIKYGRIRDGIRQPNLDRFALNCALDSIRKSSPELVMLHLVCIDSAKHSYGVFSGEVDKTLEILDGMVGEIIDACGEDYTIVMFSDHGQFDIDRMVYVNVFLEQHGLLSFENQTYDAYIECMGGSGIVRCKDDESLKKVMALLEENKDMLGIEDIYKRDMLDRLNVDEGIEYIIEAKAGYYLKDYKYKSVIKDLKAEKIACATHGYSPAKDNYSCVFFAMGDGIIKGAEIDRMEVVDIAPTAARIMGLNEFKCDGRIIDEIFN